MSETGGSYEDEEGVPIERRAFDLGRLAASVDAAVARLEDDREAQEQRIAQSVRKVQWMRRLGVLGVIVGCLGLAVGSIGLFGARKAQHAVDEIVATRVASRVAQCANDNATAARINGLNDRTQELLKDAIAPNTASSRAPAQEELAAAFLAQQLAAYERVKVPMRDCSASGIARFYDQKSP